MFTNLFLLPSSLAGVQLMAVSKISETPPASLTMTDPPHSTESSLKYVRITDHSELENDPNLLNLFPSSGMKTSKSNDSLVSLGDVELGVGDVDGVTSEGVEEVDSPQLSVMEDEPSEKVLHVINLTYESGDIYQL